MMRKYKINGEWGQESNKRIVTETREMLESDTQAIYTGLFDKNGNELVRYPEKTRVGFQLNGKK